MSLSTQIMEEIKNAMRAKDTIALEALRAIKSELLLAQTATGSQEEITEGDEIIPGMADDVFYIPEADEIIAPMLSTIPMQLLSYYVGIAKGVDVDKPRNLAKSVTVE